MALRYSELAGERAGQLEGALRGLYADPAAARGRLLAHADRAGAERTAGVLEREPGRFGRVVEAAPADRLRFGRGLGERLGLRGRDPRPTAAELGERARGAVPALRSAHEMRAEAVRRVGELGRDVPGRDLLRALRTREGRLTGALRRGVGRVPGLGREQTARALGRAVAGLSVGERVRVAAQVGAPGVAVASRAIEAVRAVGRGLGR